MFSMSLNDMAQMAKLCMAIGKEGGLAQKDITWQTVTGCLRNKAWISISLSDETGTDMSTVFQYRLKKENFCMRWSSDLEKLIYH